MPVALTLARYDRADATPVHLGTPADAHGVASLTLQGLQPAKRSEYRVAASDTASVNGTFRAFGEGPWSFRLAFWACAETGSARPVFDFLRNAQPDSCIHTGDIHYEDITKNAPDRFRSAFDAVMSSSNQSRLYRSVPTAYTWDDHDFGGNGSDASSAAKPAALAVYRQFVPHYPLEQDRSTGINQAFSVGRVHAARPAPSLRACASRRRAQTEHARQGALPASRPPASESRA